MTLPAASTFNAGRVLVVRDDRGSVAAGNTVSLGPNRSDSIDGSNSTQVVLTTAYGAVAVESDGASKWVIRKIAVMGDVTGADFIGKALNLTIASNAVTNAKAAQMAANTLKGNNTGSTANATDLTVAQVKTLLALAFTDISGTLGIGAGGTGQTTAAAARGSSGLNIDEQTGHGDSNYTILATDRVVATTASFTAPRTWTLPRRTP